VKATTRPQYHRLRRVLEMIREGARTGRAPNSGHFTRELGVSRRTVMRDLDFLRDDEKAPVAFNAKLGGYELSVVSEDYTRVKRGVWETIARHVNGRERLRVTYQRFDGAVGSYLLEPYHLVAYHGNWYVLAGKVPGGRVATFALSRCRQVGGTGEHFSRPAGFDPHAYLKQAFGISRADQPWKVRLRFSPQVATYVKERVWHPSQAFREGRDGSLEMRMETSSRKEVVRWILSWVPEVQVLAPRELQERTMGCTPALPAGDRQLGDALSPQARQARFAFLRFGCNFQLWRGLAEGGQNGLVKD
jgi:predicted DNA-binding transcriptional regulator YafY